MSAQKEESKLTKNDLLAEIERLKKQNASLRATIDNRDKETHTK